MQAIASKLVYGVRMEEKHVVDSFTIDQLKRNIIDLKDNEKDLISVHNAHVTIEKVKDSDYSKLKKSFNSLNRKVTWLKIGWISTGILLAGTTIYAMVR